MYGVNRELYQDIKAAQVLGMSEDALNNNMENRGEKKAFNALIEGEFRPLTISKDVEELFEIKSEELGVTNPFEQAQDVIDNIQEILETVSLYGDLFPTLKNPFRVPLTQGIPNTITQPFQQLGFLGEGNVTGVPTTVDTPYDQLKSIDQKIDRINKVDSLI